MKKAPFIWADKIEVIKGLYRFEDCMYLAKMVEFGLALDHCSAAAL